MQNLVIEPSLKGNWSKPALIKQCIQMSQHLQTFIWLHSHTRLEIGRFSKENILVNIQCIPLSHLPQLLHGTFAINLSYLSTNRERRSRAKSAVSLGHVPRTRCRYFVRLRNIFSEHKRTVFMLKQTLVLSTKKIVKPLPDYFVSF